MNFVLKKNNFKRFYYNLQKDFSIKKFVSSSVTNGLQVNSIVGENDTLEIKAPLQDLLAVLGTCEINSIKFHAKFDNVAIEKMQVDCNADYDLDVYLGKTKAPNTYSFIDIQTIISSSEKDKSKLQATVEKGIETCPVLSTLKLAGIKINKSVKYI